jgi:hypothetical protein
MAGHWQRKRRESVWTPGPCHATACLARPSLTSRGLGLSRRATFGALYLDAASIAENRPGVKGGVPVLLSPENISFYETFALPNRKAA